MRRKTVKLLTGLLLIAALLAQLVGCAAAPQTPGSPASPPGTGEPAAQTLRAVNLMAEITPNRAEPVSVTAEDAAAAADFAVRLFRAANEAGENTLISPLSVFCALSMTANGAEGETLAQMEKVLGLDRAQLKRCARALLDALSADGVLKAANSVWFTDDARFTVRPEFLQTNADWFGADVYRAPFDEGTLQDINNWVKEKTDGMIPEILDRIPPSALMYLVNALAFEAEWAEPYKAESVSSGNFFTESGEKRLVDYLYSNEGQYLETEHATGFLKPYKGGKYAFAALLPKEGVSVEALLESLDGAALRKLLAEPEYATVLTALPKFRTAWDGELSAVLQDMGMELPFDGVGADFSGLGSSTGGNIFISRVLHKTFLSVTEQGTRAGAATVVEMTDGCAFFEEPRQVYLERPFVYMLIDTETGVPFFLGTMLDPAES